MFSFGLAPRAMAAHVTARTANTIPKLARMMGVPPRRISNQNWAFALVAKDGVWSLRVELPAAADVEYKYTNSGEPGTWVPSEEFPSANRRIRVREGLVVENRFGKQ